MPDFSDLMSYTFTLRHDRSHKGGHSPELGKAFINEAAWRLITLQGG